MNTRRWHPAFPAAALAALSLFAPSASAQRMFRSDTALTITISTDLKSLMRERDSLKLKPRPAELSYVDSGGVTVKLPVTLKARGHFRRQARNCDFPPIWLNFKSSEVKKSLLSNLKKLK